MGNYVGDVAGYVYVAKGATQSVIRLSLTSYKVGGPIFTKKISATAASLKQAYTSTNEFFAHHTFQNPITLHFDTCRLNSGFPIDSIKFNTPINPKLSAKNKLIVERPQTPAKHRIYRQQDQQLKHHLINGYGSPNPIRDNQLLQELLETAYSNIRHKTSV